MRLYRAHEHIRTLHLQIDAFVHGGAYSIAFEPQFDEEGTIILRAVVHSEPPVIQWGVAIGEIVHNLRSALDHVAFDLAAAKEGPPPDPIPLGDKWRKVSFPITLDEHTFRSVMGQVKWAFPAGQEPHATFEALQPWNGRGDRDPLWILEELWNSDKHRTPHIVGFLGSVQSLEKVKSKSVIIQTVADASTVELVDAQLDRPFESRAEVGRVRFTSSAASTVPLEMYVKSKIVFRCSVWAGTASSWGASCATADEFAQADLLDLPRTQTADEPLAATLHRPSSGPPGRACG